MFGQIATFMEALHLTYEEVFERIPYRNLLLMSRDKMHVATGKVYHEMSEEEEREFIKQ
jgi:hypothetical protein